jgi:hypothetical protein
MPYEIKKTGHKFEVVNIETGQTHGRTTKKKAQKQLRLLNAVAHGWKPNHKTKKGGRSYARAIQGLDLLINGENAVTPGARQQLAVYNAAKNNTPNLSIDNLNNNHKENIIASTQNSIIENRRRRLEEERRQALAEEKRNLFDNSTNQYKSEREKQIHDSYAQEENYWKNRINEYEVLYQRAKDDDIDADILKYGPLYQQAIQQQNESLEIARQTRDRNLAQNNEIGKTGMYFSPIQGQYVRFGYEGAGVTYEPMHIRC